MAKRAFLLQPGATTRRAPSTLGRHGSFEHLLALGQIIVSPETGLSYKVDRLLGRGGYGQVYLAKRIGRSVAVPARLCVKISPHIDGWLREAYFGQVLDAHPRAIRVFDKFPLVRSSGQTL